MRIARRNLAAAGTVTASSTATNYSASYLVDGDTTRPWLAAAAASAVSIRCDLNALPLGTFEGASLPGTDASSGAGSTTKEASIVNAGTGALKCTAGAGDTGRRYLEITARPGETWNLSVYLRGDGTGSARLRIQDTVTGKWYVGSAWQTTEADYAARSTASYAETTVSFTMPSYATWQADSGAVRIHILCNDSGQVAYADDLACWPSWDLVILHGHNVRPGQTATVYSNTTSTWGSGTLRGTISTPRKPACYYLHGSQLTARYAEVIFPGVALEQLYVGEWWIGQSELLDPYPSATWVRERQLQQVRLAAGRRQHVTAYTATPARSLVLEWTEDADTIEPLLQQLCATARYGADLLAVVPVLSSSSGIETDVYLVRGPSGVTVAQTPPWRDRLSLRMDEDGFPTVSL